MIGASYLMSRTYVTSLYSLSSFPYRNREIFLWRLIIMRIRARSLLLLRFFLILWIHSDASVRLSPCLSFTAAFHLDHSQLHWMKKQPSAYFLYRQEVVSPAQWRSSRQYLMRSCFWLCFWQVSRLATTAPHYRRTRILISPWSRELRTCWAGWPSKTKWLNWCRVRMIDNSYNLQSS